MKKKRKIELLVLSLALVLSLMVSISYAYYYYETKQDGNNLAKSSCFKLSFEDKNDINLLDAIPISDDEAATLVPYEFTIKNVCNLAANYNVNVEELNSSTLKDSFIRYKLDNNASEILGYQDNSGMIINEDVDVSKTIDSAILLPGEERTYDLRLWIDENSTIEAANKNFSSKVVVTASLNKDPFVDVTFEPYGGQIDHSVITYVEGRKYNNLPEPHKKGYIFLGWYKTEELNDGEGIGNDTIVSSDITNLYAKYTKNTYKLSIDPNGGEYNNSPGIYETNVLYNDTFELQEVNKEGYTFTNWSVESGEETIVDNNIVTMGIEDSYVKANYDINSYKLTVKLNGGKWNSFTTDQEYLLDYHSTKDIPNPTREGYTFIGWSISSGELNGTTFTIGASDAELVANWQVNDYKWVVYHNKMNTDGNGYTLANTENGHGNYGTTFKGTLKNYTGFTNPEQSTATIKEDIKYNESGTPTNNVLNYNYVRNKYNLVVNPNGGKYESSTSKTTYSDIYYGASKTINNPTRTGYNFGGWTLGGTNSSMSGLLFTMGSDNASLTANWKVKSYTITLNNQSATTAGTQTLTAIYDSSLPKIIVPTRTEYIFEGYYSGVGGTGTKYINADGTSARTWNIDNNTTLYAKWKSEYIDINFDVYGNNNAFQHLGYTLNEITKSEYGIIVYNILKDGVEVSNLNIPATYEYNGQKYRITSTGGSYMVIMTMVKNVTSINLPNTVKTIGNYSFAGFREIKNFVIPEVVETIGESAFDEMTQLASITIPSSVKTIGERAFDYDSNLETVYIKPTNITFGKECFYNLKKLSTGYGSTIYVKSSAVRDQLLANEVTTNSYGMTVTQTDYISIKNHLLSTDYYTQVSTNYNW